MKTILSIILIALMSLSIVACDNQKELVKKQEENLTIEPSTELDLDLKSQFNIGCLYGARLTRAACDCVYSKITEKYPEIESKKQGEKYDSAKIESVFSDNPMLVLECALQ